MTTVLMDDIMTFIDKCNAYFNFLYSQLPPYSPKTIIDNNVNAVNDDNTDLNRTVDTDGNILLGGNQLLDGGSVRDKCILIGALVGKNYEGFPKCILIGSDAGQYFRQRDGCIGIGFQNSFQHSPTGSLNRPYFGVGSLAIGDKCCGNGDSTYYHYPLSKLELGGIAIGSRCCIGYQGGLGSIAIGPYNCKLSPPSENSKNSKTNDTYNVSSQGVGAITIGSYNTIDTIQENGAICIGSDNCHGYGCLDLDPQHVQGEGAIAIGRNICNKSNQGMNSIVIGFDIVNELSEHGADSIGIGVNILNQGVPQLESSICIGYDASTSIGIGAESVVIGDHAGNQKTANPPPNGLVCIGTHSGIDSTCGPGCIYIGEKAGQNANSTEYTVCIGTNAGFNSTQNDCSVSIGSQTSYNGHQGKGSLAIGSSANHTGRQGEHGVFLGYECGKNGVQDSGSLCIGYRCGLNIQQGVDAVAIGDMTCNNSSQRLMGIVMGSQSLDHSEQQDNGIIIGALNGTNQSSQFKNGIIIGNSCLTDTSQQKDQSIIIGNEICTESSIQDFRAIIIGSSNLQNNSRQDNHGILIGTSCFAAKGNEQQSSQGSSAICIGSKAFHTGGQQHENAVAILSESAYNHFHQNADAILIGSQIGSSNDGQNKQGNNSILIGSHHLAEPQSQQHPYSTGLGYNISHQKKNSIVINTDSSDTGFGTPVSDGYEHIGGCYIRPIRQVNALPEGFYPLKYNYETGEVCATSSVPTPPKSSSLNFPSKTSSNKMYTKFTVNGILNIVNESIHCPSQLQIHGNMTPQQVSSNGLLKTDQLICYDIKSFDEHTDDLSQLHALKWNTKLHEIGILA